MKKLYYSLQLEIIIEGVSKTVTTFVNKDVNIDH